MAQLKQAQKNEKRKKRETKSEVQVPQELLMFCHFFPLKSRFDLTGLTAAEICVLFLEPSGYAVGAIFSLYPKG